MTDLVASCIFSIVLIFFEIFLEIPVGILWVSIKFPHGQSLFIVKVSYL